LKVEALNRKWARGAWKPVVLIMRNIGQKALIALHAIADFCVVSSLHDGMNLVAKEFVASRVDGDGVLILSAFAGAARELQDALTVNPFALEELADAMDRAINMAPAERHRRMARMRRAVASNDVYHWAGSLLSAIPARAASAASGRSFLETAEVA
jgi:trehalose 6-phosphate synthase